MVNLIDSQYATPAEVAAAEQAAIEAYERSKVQTGEQVPNMPAETREGTIKPLQYNISPADAGSWVKVWELRLDSQGVPYGKPTRAPRQQLGLWLQKTRPDGGPRFTVAQPARVAAEPQFACVRRECGKRLYTRIDLYEHVEYLHPREFRMYKKQLDALLDAAVAEDRAMNDWLEKAARTPESGLLSVALPTVKAEEDVDVTAGAPIVQSIGIGRKIEQEAPQNPDVPPIHYCTIGGCKRFFDSAQGLNMHRSKEHKGYVPGG